MTDFKYISNFYTSQTSTNEISIPMLFINIYLINNLFFSSIENYTESVIKRHEILEILSSILYSQTDGHYFENFWKVEPEVH